MELLAKTYYGLEECLARELTELGADNIQISNRAVSFEGDLKLLYKANLQLHTALRILRPITVFKAASADDVYDNLRNFDFTSVMKVNDTFIINETVNSETMHNSQFVKYRAKDALVDFFCEKFDKRPNVSVQNPDICFDLHVSHDTVTLSLDASGDSLHLRGWRVDQTAAPISEVLAAGMIKMTGWHGESDFVDPMCGSGTLLIEAALIALNMAPCLYRRRFAFEKWHDFDADLFDEVYNDDSTERDFDHHIYGYDIDPKAVAIANRNVKAAGFSKYITVQLRSVADFTTHDEPAIMVTNPPYGKRIVTDDMFDLYRSLGTALKHHFTGNTAWVISSDKSLLTAIGMKPSAKFKLINGALECQYCRYEIFAGKHEDFVRERKSRVFDDEETVDDSHVRVKDFSKIEKPFKKKDDHFTKGKDNSFRKKEDGFKKDSDRDFHKKEKDFRKKDGDFHKKDRGDRARFFESKRKKKTSDKPRHDTPKKTQ